MKFLAISNLLASCAEGRYKYAEDICQSIYSMDELVRYTCTDPILFFIRLLHSIISDPSIKLCRRKPFARLLNWAYINTERDSLASVTTLSNSHLFWDHLNHCSVLIKLLCRYLTHDNEQVVMLKVKLLFSQHISFTVSDVIFVITFT